MASLHTDARTTSGTESTVQHLPLTVVLICLVSTLWIFKKQIWSLLGDRLPPPASRAASSRASGIDAAATDPSLLRKHSDYRSYTSPVHQITYPTIRTFYRPHPQADKLPLRPSPLPLLVFVHGLGGSLSQFHPLLVSLVNLAPCLGIDLPGCGLSEFAPAAWTAYTTQALVDLLRTVIHQYRDESSGQGIVLIGHSMGCSLAALLASKCTADRTDILKHIVGIIAICPRAAPPPKHSLAGLRRLLSLPGPIFNLWRRWDRRGGTESASVARYVGPNADQETKELQLRFNEQSKTTVWRRMAFGCLPTYNESGAAIDGLPGEGIWAKVEIPLYLIAGEADSITTPAEVDKIAAYFGKSAENPENEGSGRTNVPLHNEVNDGSGKTLTPTLEPTMHDHALSQNTRTTSTSMCKSDNLVKGAPSAISPSRPVRTETTTYPYGVRKLLRTTILPFPASHALLYSPTSCRILAGLVSAFLSEHIDRRLSLGWQLQHLTTEGKWDVKNLAKWQAVTTVSEPIAGIFRAMKTLREVDEDHYPAKFAEEWGGRIKVIVDISHESPVYDPSGLETRGISYHKFPTVSKIPPTVDEVRHFNNLIDGLRSDSTEPLAAGLAYTDQASIGVHCHYGFNRTGFFIVCYLIEREGYSVQQAIDEFQKQRPPGIRHEHFIDTLFVRYCAGLAEAYSPRGQVEILLESFHSYTQ